MNYRNHEDLKLSVSVHVVRALILKKTNMNSVQLII